jgi:xanthine dehydrogenase YagT iron-sulfur-binding subunit
MRVSSTDLPVKVVGDETVQPEQLSFSISALSRRQFVMTLTIFSGELIFRSTVFGAQKQQLLEDRRSGPRLVNVRMIVNGQARDLNLDPRVSLLDALRETLSLTGTKKGCDHGQCGACTVLADGRRINSCLSLAVQHDGAQITTIEGLASGAELHPMQSAFLEYDGLQCGYCTPGQICSAVALLEEADKGSVSYVTADLRSAQPIELSAHEIRERMSGNICRCGAYPGIVQAIRHVQDTRQRQARR